MKSSISQGVADLDYHHLHDLVFALCHIKIKTNKERQDTYFFNKNFTTIESNFRYINRIWFDHFSSRFWNSYLEDIICKNIFFYHYFLLAIRRRPVTCIEGALSNAVMHEKRMKLHEKREKETGGIRSYPRIHCW